MMVILLSQIVFFISPNEAYATHQELNRVGMWILALWASGNMLAGGAGYCFAKTVRKRFVFLGHALWNVVNLGIDIFALYNAQLAELPASIVDALHNTEKIYIGNAGLDVGYIFLGAFLWERGLRKASERFIGLGQAVVVQGLFLALFDLALFFVHLHNRGLLQNSP